MSIHNQNNPIKLRNYLNYNENCRRVSPFQFSATLR